MTSVLARGPHVGRGTRGDDRPRIEIIGEAASGLSEETRRALPEVPWPDIVAMRHRLIHGYPTVNLALVWGVVDQDLPSLRRSVTAALDRGRRESATETPTDDEPV